MPRTGICDIQNPNMIDLATNEFHETKQPFSDLLGAEVDQATYLKQAAQKLALLNSLYDPAQNVETQTEHFLGLLSDRIFLPSPAILRHITSNIPVLFDDVAFLLSDDTDHIFDTLKRASLFLQNHTRVTIDFSALRAKRSGAALGNKQFVGPIRLMELFERTPQPSETPTKLNFTLSLDHLEIDDCLHYIRTAPKHIEYTIGVPNQFVSALARKERFFLRHQPHAEPSTSIDAIKLFHKLINLIRDDHPIDLVFTDKINAFKQQRALPTNLILNGLHQLVWPGELMATGVIDLTLLTEELTDHGDKLRETMARVINFLDNTFDLNHYFDKDSEALTTRTRRLGISINGLDTLLTKMNPEHSPNKNQHITSKLAHTIKETLIEASHKLGQQRGYVTQVSFANHPIKTRNTQLLAQIHDPLLANELDATNFLMTSPAPLTQYPEHYDTHLRWQEVCDNLVSLPHPLHHTDLDTFVKLFFLAFEKGFLSFETVRA